MYADIALVVRWDRVLWDVPICSMRAVELQTVLVVPEWLHGHICVTWKVVRSPFAAWGLIHVVISVHQCGILTVEILVGRTWHPKLHSARLRAGKNFPPFCFIVLTVQATS